MHRHKTQFFKVKQEVHNRHRNPEKTLNLTDRLMSRYYNIMNRHREHRSGTSAVVIESKRSWMQSVDIPLMGG